MCEELEPERPEAMRWCGPGDVVVVTTMGKIVVDPDLSRETWPTARKRHKCCECRKRISKGDKYQLIEGLWDGDSWERYKTCATCAEMRNYAARQFNDGIPFGQLEEHLARDVEEALRGPMEVP